MLIPILAPGGISRRAVVRDTFTDTNGTSLASHTPELGGPWTAVSGTAAIQSNKWAASVGSTVFTTLDVGKPNFTLDVDFTLSTSDSFAPYLWVRYADASNNWQIYRPAGGDTWYLDECTAGVTTTRATGTLAITNGNTYGLRVVCSGPNITLLVDGTPVLTYSSTSQQTNTIVGLRLDRGGGLVPASTYDTLAVTKP